jgi:CRP/FNR family transcriptional regulator, cyclic AMP receptor protein
MQHSALWYFEHFGLLQGLSDEQKQEVSHRSRMFEVKRGHPVYLTGDPSAHVYLVKTGAVKILGRAPEGGEVILSVLTPGDIFGELALAGDEPRDHRAEAADDTLLCEIPRDVLIHMIRDVPAFALHVTKLMGLRVRTLRTRVEELLGKSAPARLAHTLLELARQHGIKDGDGLLIPLRLSQGDLGKLVGLTRETVNSIFGVWRDQGVVDIDRRCIRVRDPERLRRMR